MEYEWYKEILPQSKKEVEIRNWLWREEEEFSRDVNNNKGDEEKQLELQIYFVKNHIKDQKIFNTLCKVDFFYILLLLRNNSKGNKIEFNYKCTNNNYKKDEDSKPCKCPVSDQYQQSYFDVIKDITYKTTKIDSVDIDDNLKVTLKPLPFIKELDILKQSESISQLKYNTILNCIESVIYKGELKNFSSTKEVNDFINNLLPKQVYKLIDNYDKIITDININRSPKCVKCQHEMIISIRNLDIFF